MNGNPRPIADQLADAKARLSRACLACLRGEAGAPETADEARSEVEALLLLQAAGTDEAGE